MGAVSTSLRAFAKIVSDAVAPDQVVTLDGSHDGAADAGTAAVVLAPSALQRIGRSNRSGPLLDLELVVLVTCVGEHQLDNLEKLFSTLEAHSRYQTSALATPTDDMDRRHLGFAVRVPVSLHLEEPSGPPVQEPLDVRIEIRESTATN